MKRKSVVEEKAIKAVTEKNKNDDGTDIDGYFTHPKGHIRDKVVLHETKDSPKEGQFVALNGFPFQILYNKEVMLPRPVVEMLQNCVFVEIQKNEMTGEQTERHIPRFNISVVQRGVNLSELRPKSAEVGPVEDTEALPKRPTLETKRG